MMTSFPSSLLPTLSPVVTFLRTLPLPSTHPSHPAAGAILATLKEAQQGYADMRGNWSVKCLEGQGKRLVVRAETVDALMTGREFREWVELMLGTAEVCSFLLSVLPALSFSLPGRIQAPPRAESTFKPSNGRICIWNTHGTDPQVIQLGPYTTHRPHQEVSVQIQLPCTVSV